MLRPGRGVDPPPNSCVKGCKTEWDHTFGFFMAAQSTDSNCVKPRECRVYNCSFGVADPLPNHMQENLLISFFLWTCSPREDFPCDVLTSPFPVH